MYYSETLSSLQASGNLRTIPTGDSDQGVIDLSSNDYLGIAADSSITEEFMNSCPAESLRFSSSAARLLAAHQSEYSDLENLLRRLYHRDILIMNSGYHANTGALSALADHRTLIVADKLVHASIIDGITLSKAPFERFRHNDMAHLDRILAAKASGYDRVIVVTESVFSMDGDQADIEALTELKKKYAGMMLYVDEAHAFGVLGEGGLGLCRNNPDIDIIVGTFGKAAASVGAFIAADSAIIRFLINRARSFIFSTAIPPVNCAWTRFIVDRITGMDSRRDHLRRLGNTLSEILSAHTGRQCQASHIQPLIVGDANLAVNLSQQLRGDGFKVLPIRTPTVPPGTERLRFSLSASISPESLTGLDRALKRSI